MILNKITSSIKCDSVLCFKNAEFEIKTQIAINKDQC